jgi:hypothetical protein
VAVACHDTDGDQDEAAADGVQADGLSNGDFQFLH